MTLAGTSQNKALTINYGMYAVFVVATITKAYGCPYQRGIKPNQKRIREPPIK
jgi:hypothetical protein